MTTFPRWPSDDEMQARAADFERIEQASGVKLERGERETLLVLVREHRRRRALQPIDTRPFEAIENSAKDILSSLDGLTPDQWEVLRIWTGLTLRDASTNEPLSQATGAGWMKLCDLVNGPFLDTLSAMLRLLVVSASDASAGQFGKRGKGHPTDWDTLDLLKKLAILYENATGEKPHFTNTNDRPQGKFPDFLRAIKERFVPNLNVSDYRLRSLIRDRRR